MYEPSDDTELLLATLDVRPGERVLDIGTGVGAAAIKAALAGARVIAADVNPHSARLTRWNARENGVHVDTLVADLAEPIAGRFDVVIFNLPYLPTDIWDHVEGPIDKAFDGGPDGLDVARRFLPRLPRLLAPHGRAYLVMSSLADPLAFRRIAESAGLRVEEAASAAFSMEKIYIYRLRA